MIKLERILVATAMAMMLAGTATAQIGASGGDILVTSKEFQSLQKEGKGIYTGEVVATQGNARITTEKLTVICAPPPPGAKQQSCEELQKMIAEGNVLYVASDTTGNAKTGDAKTGDAKTELKIRGDRAEYDYPTDTITITGDVIMSRGNEGVVKATKVVYNVGGGITQMTAGDGRVFSIFPQTKKNGQAQPEAAPATPPAAPAARPN